jgi:hypothetical protein
LSPIARVQEDGCVAPAVWAARDTEATRGVTLGLGALPGRMLAPHAERVIEVRP